ncbi:MAG: arsenical resistance operon transcriptional repressor ArsD [Verrucomicrobiales bacterium]|nr:arsenical resistance operon transcriptional repressor ArsD [Verrucomicrobiales bacterium]
MAKLFFILIFMKNIQVYDPALCCPTGVCGPSVDPDLVRVSALIAKLKKDGHSVERYNLGQQPTEFITNSVVKTVLAEEGVECLPLIFIDGQLVSRGEYPDLSVWNGWLEDGSPEI